MPPQMPGGGSRPTFGEEDFTFGEEDFSLGGEDKDDEGWFGRIKKVYNEMPYLHLETYKNLPKALGQIGTDIHTLSPVTTAYYAATKGIEQTKQEQQAAARRLFDVLSSPTARAEVQKKWGKWGTDEEKREFNDAVLHSLVPLLGEQLWKGKEHLRKGEYEEWLGTGADVALNVAGPDLAALTLKGAGKVAGATATRVIPRAEAAAETLARRTLDPNAVATGPMRDVVVEAAPLIARDRRFRTGGPAGKLGASSLVKGTEAILDDVRALEIAAPDKLNVVDATGAVADSNHLAKYMENKGRGELGLQGEANVPPTRAHTRTEEGAQFDAATDTVRAFGGRGVRWSQVYSHMEDMYKGVTDSRLSSQARDGNRLAYNTIADYMMDNAPAEIADHVKDLQYNRIMGDALRRANKVSGQATVGKVANLKGTLGDVVKLLTPGSNARLSASQFLAQIADYLKEGRLAKAEALAEDVRRDMRGGRVGARPMEAPPEAGPVPLSNREPTAQRAPSVGAAEVDALVAEMQAGGATPEEIAGVRAALAEGPAPPQGAPPQTPQWPAVGSSMPISQGRPPDPRTAAFMAQQQAGPPQPPPAPGLGGMMEGGPTAGPAMPGGPGGPLGRGPMPQGPMMAPPDVGGAAGPRGGVSQGVRRGNIEQQLRNPDAWDFTKVPQHLVSVARTMGLDRAAAALGKPVDQLQGMLQAGLKPEVAGNPFESVAGPAGTVPTGPGTFSSAAMPEPPSPDVIRRGPTEPIPQVPPPVVSRTNAPVPAGSGNLGQMMAQGEVAAAPPIAAPPAPPVAMPLDMMKARVDKYGESGAARSMNITVQELRRRLAAGPEAALPTPPVTRLETLDAAAHERMIQTIIREKGWIDTKGQMVSGARTKAEAELTRRYERTRLAEAARRGTGPQTVRNEQGVSVPVGPRPPAAAPRVRGENAVDATIETVRWRDAQVKRLPRDQEHAYNVTQAIDDALNRGLKPENYESLEELQTAIGQTPYTPRSAPAGREARHPWLRTEPRPPAARVTRAEAEAERPIVPARTPAEEAALRAEAEARPPVARSAETGVLPDTPISAGAMRPRVNEAVNTATEKLNAARARGRLTEAGYSDAMARIDSVRRAAERQMETSGGISTRNIGHLGDTLDRVIKETTGPRPNKRLDRAVDQLVRQYERAKGGKVVSTIDDEMRRQLLKDVTTHEDFTPEMRARVEAARGGAIGSKFIRNVMASSTPGAGAPVFYKPPGSKLTYKYTPRFARTEDAAAHALASEGRMGKGARDLRTKEIAEKLGIPESAVPEYVDIVSKEVERQIGQSGMEGGKLEVHIDPRIGEALTQEFKGAMPRPEMIEFISTHPDVDLATISNKDLAAALQDYYEPPGAPHGPPVKGRDYAAMAQQIRDVNYIGIPKSKFGRGRRASEMSAAARERSLGREYTAGERLAAEREQLGRGVVASPEMAPRPIEVPEEPGVGAPVTGPGTGLGPAQDLAGLGPGGRRDVTAQQMINQEGTIPAGPEIGPPVAPPARPSPIIASPAPPTREPSVVGRVPRGGIAPSGAAARKQFGTTEAQELSKNTVRQLRKEGLHMEALTDLQVAQHVARAQGKPIPKTNAEITIDQKRAIDGLKMFRDIYLKEQRAATTPARPTPPPPVPGRRVQETVARPTSALPGAGVPSPMPPIDPRSALGRFTAEHPMNIAPSWARLTDGELLAVIELRRGGTIPEGGFRGRDVKGYDRPLVDQLRKRAQEAARLEGNALSGVFDVNAVRSPWELAGVGERIPGAGMADVLDRLTVNTPDIEPPTAVVERPKVEVTKKAKKRRR